MRYIAALALSSLALAGCASPSTRELTREERNAIADSIRNLVTSTYDLVQPNAVSRLMSLYPDSGAIYSTSSGHVSSTRPELERQIQGFWQYVGSNMRNPKWEWTSMRIDVLARDAAVMTAAYRVPHLTPQNTPHTIAGAWTAVFVKRGGRWVVIQEHLSDVPARTAAQPADHSGH